MDKFSVLLEFSGETSEYFGLLHSYVEAPEILADTVMCINIYLNFGIPTFSCRSEFSER